MKASFFCGLTTQYVMSNAHSRYWYGADDECELAPEHHQFLRKGKRNAWPTLTEKRLRAGVAAMVQWATAMQSAHAAEMLGRVISMQADGNDLDVLLQFALFGELIYEFAGTLEGFYMHASKAAGLPLREHYGEGESIDEVREHYQGNCPW